MKLIEAIGNLVIRLFCPAALQSAPMPLEYTMTATEGHSFSNYQGYSENAVLAAHHEDRPGE